MRDSCCLIVLLGLRTGNRAWLEQEAGYIQLARELARQYGSVGFILDGMSEGTKKGWTHQLMSLDDESKLSERIIGGISKFAPCTSTVAGTMFESLLATELCDLYVAPGGSGLAKYKWISNKPGVFICNSTVLDTSRGEGWPIRVFESFRDDIKPSRFIDPRFVTDEVAEQRPSALHANFHLDWKHVFDAAKAVIEEQLSLP
jgi:hypothetical protein